MSIIGFLVFILVICIVLWVTRMMLAAFKIEDPIATIIYVTVVLVILLEFLAQLGYGPGVKLRL